VGCAQPSSPTNPSVAPQRRGHGSHASSPAVENSATGTLTPIAAIGRPEYELAYYNGTIVTMNHISVPQNPQALDHAAADLYAVFYPANHALWPAPPLCNPCDPPREAPMTRATTTTTCLDSIPSDPGHGEFNPLWHVFAIMPVNSSAAAQAAFRPPGCR
jgi:hypothetical protein